VFVEDRHPVLLSETRSRLIARSTGSHLAMWDDQQNYFAALLGFRFTSTA
jgi:hypothetical protein